MSENQLMTLITAAIVIALLRSAGNRGLLDGIVTATALVFLYLVLASFGAQQTPEEALQSAADKAFKSAEEFFERAKEQK